MEQTKYEIDIFWSEEDGGYIADVPALRYCSAFGETHEEALQEVLEAIDLHLEVLEETGRPIPEPDSPVRGVWTDRQSEERINQAAEQFADAVKESYRVVASERGMSAQELNAELTQNFFNGVINNLRNQAVSNREMTEQLIEQQQRQREATQALAQESVNTYMDFVNSMFSYWKGNVEQAQRQAQQSQREARQ